MPRDDGIDYTDSVEKLTVKRLRKIYRQAQYELSEKLYDFWRRHDIKNQIYLEQVRDGTLDIEDYQAWLRGQVFQGKQWEAKLKHATDAFVNADKLAAKIVNGGKLDVFAANANYIGYELEHGAGIDLGFGVYDSATVARLIKDEPKLLPAIKPEKIKPGEDAEWYQKVIRNSVTQGILQGESVQQIVGRIAEQCASVGENAAMRDARTAYTGAQNAGRVEGMRQARDDLGIKVKKRWMATFDFKTRETHRELDGQVVDIDDDFIVDGKRIAYPGDPTADPALVYNCRCTLVYDHPEYPSEIERVDDTNGENVGAMTYKQWYRMKTTG